MAQSAAFTVLGASFIIPAAGPLAMDFFKSECDPSAFAAGAETWWKVADTMWNAAGHAQATHDKAQNDDWSGGDPEAFKDQLNDYKHQLELSALMCNYIAIILMVTAVLLFVLILLMLIIAGLVAILLVLIAVESAATLMTGYGAAVAQASAITSEVNVTVWEPFSEMIETILNVLALALGGGLIAELAGQVATGNTGALKDFVFAQGPAIDVIARGTLNRLERKVTTDGMAGGFSTETTALSKIPLIQKIPFVSKIVDGYPNITKMIPDGPLAVVVGAGARGVGGYDTATQNYLLTGGLISKDNNQVG